MKSKPYRVTPSANKTINTLKTLLEQERRDNAQLSTTISKLQAQAGLIHSREQLRFVLDTESGYVKDNVNNEWLTTAQEVFEAMTNHEN